jgi:hypothetical protein
MWHTPLAFLVVTGASGDHQEGSRRRAVHLNCSGGGCDERYDGHITESGTGVASRLGYDVAGFFASAREGSALEGWTSDAATDTDLCPQHRAPEDPMVKVGRVAAYEQDIAGVKELIAPYLN